MSAAARDSVLFTETFKALAKAVKRKDYESDSDDYIDHSTNRGSKLKKRARFVRQGQLGPPSGPSTYKETIEHAGYHRTIISRKPPLVDEEGYELDSGDDEERIAEAQAAVAEDDPYSSIRIEEILAPLTSAADLANHAILSRPFRSSALTELSTQGLGLLHKEREALSKVRPLLTRLCGDHIWASCDMMLGPNDDEIFTSLRNTTRVQRPAATAHARSNPSSGAETSNASPKTNGTKAPVNGSHLKGNEPRAVADHPQPAAEEEDPDVTMEDLEPSKQQQQHYSSNGAKAGKPVNGDRSANQDPTGAGDDSEQLDPDETIGEDEATGAPNGENNTARHNNKDDSPGSKLDKEPRNPARGPKEKGVGAHNRGAAAEAWSEAGGTRQQQQQQATGANGVASAPGLSDGLGDDAIHPYFMVPASSHTRRDAGLPENEAEEIRRLLQLYVQKQEEVCRGTKDLYEGLLRADRMRREVLKWSKAEAHCGPNRDMSDGEDWYDKDEWGLVEDLKKGQDEEEEDTTARDQPKKTRNRR